MGMIFVFLALGFLESLPSRQTVWKDEDQIDPIRRVTGEYVLCSLVSKNSSDSVCGSFHQFATFMQSFLSQLPCEAIVYFLCYQSLQFALKR